MMVHEIDVLYSDRQLTVVNKPADLLSVPGVGPEKQDCVVKRLQGEFPTIRIVHRLDCATSGLMVLALDRDSHRELSRQFHDREVYKRYIADLEGELAIDSGKVEQPLICDWPNRPRQIISAEGKAALTYFRCIRSGAEQSRVELEPHTGRSHQLRVHMQYLGHPIVGDKLYGTLSDTEDVGAVAKRLHLHASALSFRHPFNGNYLEFESDAPF